MPLANVNSLGMNRWPAGVQKTSLSTVIASDSAWSATDRVASTVTSYSNIFNEQVATGKGLRGTRGSDGYKRYFEIVQGTNVVGYSMGLATLASLINGEFGTDKQSIGYVFNTNTTKRISYNGGQLANNMAGAAGAKDVISIAYDPQGLVYFAFNNTWANSANPTQGINGFVVQPQQYFPAASTGSGAAQGSNNIFAWLINTGGVPFTYTPPSGFLPWT